MSTLYITSRDVPLLLEEVAMDLGRTAREVERKLG